MVTSRFSKTVRLLTNYETSINVENRNFKRKFLEHLLNEFIDEAEKEIVYGADNNNVKIVISILSDVISQIRTTSKRITKQDITLTIGGEIIKCDDFIKNFKEFISMSYTAYFTLPIEPLNYAPPYIMDYSRKCRNLGISYDDFLKLIGKKW